MVPEDRKSIGFTRLIPHFIRDRLWRRVCGAKHLATEPAVQFYPNR